MSRSTKRTKGLLINFEDRDLPPLTTDASTQTDVQGIAEPQVPEVEKNYNKRTWKLKNDIGFRILGEILKTFSCF